MNKKHVCLIILGLFLAGCGNIIPLGYCEDDGLFYYEVNGERYSETRQQLIDWGFDPDAYGNWCPPRPKSPELKEVISNMWLLVESLDTQELVLRYCILISDTHPSIEQQESKCFPGSERPFKASSSPCAGPVWVNNTWACDSELREHGWSRLSLEELCQRYPDWCE